MSHSPPLSYAGSGVVAAGKPLSGLLSWVNKTLSFRKGLGEPALGIVALDRLIVGQDMVPGDVVVGLASSGIHSNGLTLARKVLFETAGLAPERHVDELGRTVGEELLEPTRIYVRPVWQMITEGL